MTAPSKPSSASPRPSPSTINHLLIDDIPRRPPHAAEHSLGDRLTALGELSGDDLNSLLHVLDALVAENRINTLASGIS